MMEKFSDEDLEKYSTGEWVSHSEYTTANLATELLSTRKQLAELQERMRWIPVGERLPEEQVKVLTEFDGVIMIDCVQDGRWFLRSFVTYWKPIELPEVVK